MEEEEEEEEEREPHPTHPSPLPTSGALYLSGLPYPRGPLNSPMHSGLTKNNTTQDLEHQFTEVSQEDHMCMEASKEGNMVCAARAKERDLTALTCQEGWKAQAPKEVAEQAVCQADDSALQLQEESVSTTSKESEKTNTMKKTKKGSRLLKNLKFLCCCWCKTQQQDEEVEEYVHDDRLAQAEGEQGGVGEESGSLAHTTSQTAPPLPLMCSETQECESDQSVPEECMGLQDQSVSEECMGLQDPVLTSPEDDILYASDGNGESLEGDTCPPPEGGVTEEEQAAFIDYTLIQSIYGLIEDPVKTSTTQQQQQASECVEENGKAERQTESRAARRRRRRKNKVQHQEKDNGGKWQAMCNKQEQKNKVQHQEKDSGGEWQTVCSKQKQKKTETAAVQARETPAGKPAKLQPQRAPRQSKAQRRANNPPQGDRFRVRLSWQENPVKVTVPVPPDRRRHVIGTRGDNIRQLKQQYPAVRVSVPGQQDLTSWEVTIEGPKTQAEAAAQHIIRTLQAAEEAEQRCQERQRVAGGETLRRLAQQHPAVRVTVPAPSDTRTASVSIRGPRHEATLIAECVRASVQAAGPKQRHPNPNNRKH